MKKINHTYFLTVTAISNALVYVFTAFINIRLPLVANGGLIHLGNVPLFIVAMLYGKKVGALAGGVGMGFFDLLSGWTVWAPFTLVIVGLMGYTIGSICEKHSSYSAKIISMTLACAIKIIGYYFAESIIYGNFLVPISSIPGNLVQIGIASIIVITVIEPLSKAVSRLNATVSA